MTYADWAWRPLGELFDIGAGKTMSSRAREGVDKVPFLRTSNVLWDRVDLSSVDEMAIPPQELADKLLRPGDLLVCEGGEIGRAAVWTGQIETCSFQNHLHRLRPRSGDVDPRFYVYFLQAAFTQLGIFEGAGNKTTIPNLSRTRLAALNVPHPLQDEQRAIVEALATVRLSIGIHGRNASLAEELKRAAMLRLFTRGLRDEPSKDSEVGPVPKNWSVESLGAHHSVTTGATPSRSNPAYWTAGTIPWVKTTEIQYRVICETAEHITEAALAEYSVRLLAPGTLLLAMYGQGVTRGKVALLGIEATCNQACAAINASDGSVDTRYLYHFLTYRYEEIRQLAHGGQQQNLNLDLVRSIPIAFPEDVKEQREIAAALDVVDSKIDLHKQRLARLDELFATVLYKVMTGAVHADDIDTSALAGVPALGEPAA
jgi:type I restriction enzyme S subunit